MSSTAQPAGQLELISEQPLVFLAIHQGRLVDVVNVEQCGGGWHEASLWCSLAIQLAREEQTGAAPGRIDGEVATGRRGRPLAGEREQPNRDANRPAGAPGNRGVGEEKPSTGSRSRTRRHGPEPAA